MVYRHRRQRQCRRQRLGESGADEEGTGEARPLRVGDGIDRRQRTAAGGQHLPQEGHQTPDVVTRGEFRHHAAIFGVHPDL
ncbi:MAG: hypothetical protein AW07_01731 [Candidatus Accumulibacter sp. SK-11]|nr:MAG: hypothetical protein AW07_01731 [Candidatus Accumulibacter sp. SK-11]